MQRMGLCIGVKAGAIADYKRVHAAVLPEVLEVISRANTRNYSIFLHERRTFCSPAGSITPATLPHPAKTSR